MKETDVWMKETARQIEKNTREMEALKKTVEREPAMSAV
jgi:hypothetical protein